MSGYLVNELFSTFQGEGVHMGRPAFFVRLHGCDQACPWCDAAGTWHPRFNSKKTRMTIEEIVGECPVDFPIVVITGGEPTIQDLTELVRAFHENGQQVHLETAGHHPIRGAFDWVTLSPKPLAKPPLRESVLRADELKIIVDEEGASDKALNVLFEKSFGGDWNAYWSKLSQIPVWLHPEWSKVNDPRILHYIIGKVKVAPTARPHNNGEYIDYRAGFQLHKLYKVDQLDPRADDRLIPLGGTKGSSR